MEIHDNFYSDEGRIPEVEQPVQQFDTFRPLNDLVLVKRYVEDNSKKGSFIVPEKFREQSNRGLVRGIGPHVQTFKWVEQDDIEAPPIRTVSLAVGDLVTFGIGNAENIIVNGEELLLIRDNDIRGVERAL